MFEAFIEGRWVFGDEHREQIILAVALKDHDDIIPACKVMHEIVKFFFGVVACLEENDVGMQPKTRVVNKWNRTPDDALFVVLCNLVTDELLTHPGFLAELHGGLSVVRIQLVQKPKVLLFQSHIVERGTIVFKPYREIKNNKENILIRCTYYTILGEILWQQLRSQSRHTV